MTGEQGHHKFQRKEDLARFIRWTAKSYQYGSWAAHTRKLLDIAKKPDKLLLRYEQLSSDPTHS